MTISAFGVDHGVISKSDALGSPEAILGAAHARGEHDGPETFKRCPKCNAGAFKAVSRSVATMARAKAG